jgi:hypothetical protein
MNQEDPLTKLRIKNGAVEIECEGTDEFLRKELPGLLKEVLEICPDGPPVLTGGGESGGQQESVRKPSRGGSISTSTVASTLTAKKGTDLALAAVAALVLGQGKESVSRSELLDAMKSAKAYYKGSYNNNLSNYLNTLVKSGALLDHGNDQFGLQDGKRKEIAGKLGLGK